MYIIYVYIHVRVHLCAVSLESRLFHSHMWHVCLKLAPSICNLPLTYRIWELIWCNPKLLFVCHRLSWFIPYESDHKWSVWHNHVEISRVIPICRNDLRFPTVQDRAWPRSQGLYFVWSPPWHLYILLLANLLAFYLTYLLAFYLAYLLAFYLAYYLLKSSGILSGKHSGALSGILSDILSGILSGIPSGVLSGISSNILSGISCGTLSGISSNILSGISSGTLSGISSGISIWPLRSSGAHWAGKVPGWGPAVHTELGRPQVEVQQCTLSWEHWAGKVPGWSPALRTELGRSQVEVQQCALSSEVGEELGEELARRKWRWKLMQTWSRRNWRRRRRRRRRSRRSRTKRRRRATALIKSNNPHLAGGEKTKRSCRP